MKYTCDWLRYIKERDILQTYIDCFFFIHDVYISIDNRMKYFQNEISRH